MCGDQYGDAPAALWRRYINGQPIGDLTEKSFGDTANGLLKDHVSGDLLERLALPIKLRATSLLGRPVALEKNLLRVKDMGEERALIILSFLRERPELQDQFWENEHDFSTSYIALLVQDCTSAFPTMNGNEQIFEFLTKRAATRKGMGQRVEG